MTNDGLLLILVPLFTATLRTACPVILAAVGEVCTQRSGVMNLGLEGVMTIGALACYGGTILTGSLLWGVLLAVLVGLVVSGLHAFLSISMGLEQIISGLMIGYLAEAVADLLGRPLMGEQIPSMPVVQWGALSGIPIVGEIFFQQNILVYVTFVLVILVWVVLKRTKLGLRITAVGDFPRAAAAAGIDVIRTRYGCVLFGGMLAGLGGAYIATVYSSVYAPGLIAGKGWIAIALVVFSSYRPIPAALGGLLFGGIEAFQFRMDLMNIQIPYHLMRMLPYIVTILVLVISQGSKRWSRLLSPPNALGRPYRRE